MQGLIADLRWGFRLLFKSPGFTIAALLSLSIGIGVTTLVFTFASSAFFRAIRVPDPDRFVSVHAGRPTFSEYLAIRDQTRSQLDLVAWLSGSAVFTTETDSGSARILTVSDNYFEALGVRPAAGSFPRVDQVQSAADTCVISHHLWTSRLGGSREALGRIVRLGNRNVTITAIGPRDFRGTDLVAVDIWLPALSSHRKSDKLRWQLSGRLRPRVRTMQAATALEQGYRALGIGSSEIGGRSRVGVQSLSERERFLYAPVTFFTGLGFLVLLVGCANVAGLLSTRSIERRTEIAVRLALGSGRLRLVRLLLTESALLAVLAGGIALLMTWGLVGAVKPWLPQDLLGVSLDQVSVDTRALVATLALACVATFVAGLLPAWRAARIDLVSAMKGNAFVSGALNPRVSMRKTLVVLQLAVTFVFICIGSLFMRSMSLPETSDVQADRLIVVNLLGVGGEQTGLAPKVIHGLVLEMLKAVPGVEQVTIASSPPLAAYHTTPVRLPADSSRAAIGGAALVSTLSSYFETTGAGLVRGRTFSDHSQAQAGGEVVISQSMARRLWPDLDPLGRSVILGDARAPSCVVVGIAKDVRSREASLYQRRPEPVVYVPAYSPAAEATGASLALVRTHGPAASFLPEIRRAFLKLPVAVETPECQSLENHLRFLYRPQRFGALFALILGLLAGTLATFGLYSVTSSMVAARTREIGIRVALGATVGHTVGLFLKQGMGLSLAGIILGIPLAWGAARVLRSGMFGIVAVDPWTMGISALAVAAATLAASYLPARRAARVDPITALRTE